MDLINFPQELVDALAGYLSLNDVIACSQVNKQWEKAFNSNRIWKRFCSYHSDYFSRQVSKLVYTVDDVADRCQAKENVFKEKFVELNILQGKYCTEEVFVGSVYCDALADKVDDVGNHWLFISCMKILDFESLPMLQAWNINSSPFLHASADTPLEIMKRQFGTEITTNKDKIFYILEEVVLIYSFFNPQYELKFLHKVVFEPIVLEQAECFQDTAFAVCRGMILGFRYLNCCDLRAPHVNVWNEEGSLIHKNYNLPLPLDQVSNAVQSERYPVLNVDFNGSDNVLVSYQVKTPVQITCVLQLFNVHSLQYRFIDNFDENEDSKLVWRTTIHEAVIVVYKTAKFHKVKHYNKHSDLTYETMLLNDEIPCHITSDSEGKDLVVLTKDKIVVFDLLEREMKRSFMVGLGRFKSAQILRGEILVLQYLENRKAKHEIWNYKSGKKLYDINVSLHLGFHQDFYRFSFMKNYRFPPKMIALEDPVNVYPYYNNRSKVRVINFW